MLKYSSQIPPPFPHTHTQNFNGFSHPCYYRNKNVTVVSLGSPNQSSSFRRKSVRKCVHICSFLFVWSVCPFTRLLHRNKSSHTAPFQKLLLLDMGLQLCGPFSFPQRNAAARGTQSLKSSY